MRIVAPRTMGPNFENGSASLPGTIGPMPRPPRTVAAPSPFTGKTLGRCLIGKPLGKGATATVYRATYVPLKREVAVKILRPDAAVSEEARRDFVEEARALAKLDHPGVVKVFDVVEDQGYLLIIMDYVPGRNLRQAVEEDGPLDPAAAVDGARQIAAALDHAHSQKILHRDVKPSNIIVGEDGKAVLVDFGNAEVVGDAADRKGTAHYTAPEVFRGKHQDERTDTYALGATLFHLLAGEPPYEGASVKEILEAHESGKVRAPSQVNPEGGIPRSLDTLVKRAMAPARGYRYLAKELDEALEKVQPDIEEGPRRGRGRRGAGRGRAAAPAGTGTGTVVMVVLGVLLLAGMGFALLRKGDEKPAAEEPKKKADAGEMGRIEIPADAGHGPVDPGIDKRAASRGAREEAASKAYAEATAFADANPGRPKEAAAKFAAVASEYAELGVGRMARDAEKIWKEKALSAAEKARMDAELAAEVKKEKDLRDKSLQRCEEAAAKLRFAEALAALEEVDPPQSQKDDWTRRRARLNLLIDFTQSIGSDLEGNAVPVQRIAPSLGRLGEKVIRADEEGITLDGTAGSRRIAWTAMKPADVLSLCRQVMGSRGERRLLLAAYCWESGQRAEAKKEMETAILADRTGTMSGRVEALFGPEEQR